MGFADDLIKKVFGQKSAAGHLVIEEGTIKRSAQFIAQYEKWIKENAPEIFEEIRRNIQLKRKGLHDELNTVWLQMDHAKGFRVDLDTLLDESEDQFVLEAVKDAIQGFPYRLSTSYYKTSAQNETINRESYYYLKPPLTQLAVGEILQQQFGNIKVELVQTNKRRLKILVTTYPGRMYEAPLAFEQFLDYLFDRLST